MCCIEFSLVQPWTTDVVAQVPRWLDRASAGIAKVARLLLCILDELISDHYGLHSVVNDTSCELYVDTCKPRLLAYECVVLVIAVQLVHQCIVSVYCD